MLSIIWLTTAELSNRHSYCRAVCSSIRGAGGGKREYTARPRASQRFSMGLRSSEYAGHAKRAIPFTIQVVIDDVSSMGMCVIVH
ncbi:uncharacterized protein TNCV_3709191 [Trichonephila clavipes]|nr:uncharacterized protein TNCV_3709191 [Trichonephila clavipes]